METLIKNPLDFLPPCYLLQNSILSPKVLKGETSTDGYALVDIQGGWPIGRDISLQFWVNNLFDTHYVDHLNARNPFTATLLAEPGRILFGELA